MFVGYLNTRLLNKIMDEHLAEFVGSMIGDGCLSVINSEKRKRKIALLTGHLFHDSNYYETVIRPIVQKEFGTDGYLQKRKKRNCIYFVMSGIVFDFLHNVGFPVGRKYNLFIHDEIFKYRDLSIACVRGIFDTDGSIYRRYSKRYASHTKVYDYLVIQFKMDSKKTIEQIKEILARLQIETNKIISERNSYVLRITKQEYVTKFMEMIKPSNKYHVERYINRCKKAQSNGPLAQLVEHSKI